MRGWTGQNAWKEWSGRLAVAEEDDFERAVLPLLRLTWPGMRQAPRKKSWDQRGIDLFVWAEEGPLPCAVQCKGFKVQEIGPDQYRQIEESVQKFIASDSVATTYVVVHNREGRRRDLVARVEALLAEAVSRGKAKEALLWDRQRVVTQAFEQMVGRLRDALRKNSSDLAQHFENLFRFSGKYVAQVPVSERSLTFRRDQACEISDVSGPVLGDPRAAIEAASGTRWTILTGQFGVGKTTTALAAARQSKKPTVFVPCQTIPTKVFTAGNTNGLMQCVVENLALLDDVDDRDRNDLRRMAGAVLSYVLREPDSSFAFILDGLDEHHFFSTLNGLQRLSNQLAELSGPVVLTTRREHLETILGDFNAAFAGLGTKFGSVRQARALYLEQWTYRETLAVVDAAVAGVVGAERDRLADFRDLIERGGAEELYGGLVYHPLFLQFTLEDIAEHGASRSERCVLIKRWVQRKIRRDRQLSIPWASESRVQVDPQMDTDEYIERIFAAMQHVAYEMSEGSRGGRQLSESLPGERVQAIVRETMNRGEIELLPVLLNSVLTTLGPRHGVNVPVGFALRVLHEYFLASYLVENRLDTDGWPLSVRELAEELEEGAVR